MSDSQQPDDKESNEETKPEQSNITGPLKDNPAVAWTALISFLGFVATLAWAENHHTTLIWTAITGMVCCLLMFYLYGPFRKKRKNTTTSLRNHSGHLLPAPQPTLDDHQSQPKPLINNQQPNNVQSRDDEIRRRLEQAKTKTQRTQERAQELEASNQELRDKYKTTELQYIDPAKEAETKPMQEQESTESNKEVFGPPNPKTPIRTIPFPSGPGDLWKEYTQDVFHGVIWSWHYKFDNTPRNLVPFCPECERPNPLPWQVNRHLNGNWYSIDLKCRFHPKHYSIRLDHNPYDEPFEIVKKAIMRKIEDDSWFEALNQQRKATGLPEHNPSMAPSPHRLDGIKEQILIALAKCSGCHVEILQHELDFQYFQLGVDEKPNLIKAAVEHQLEELEEQKYVIIELYGHKPTQYSLDRKGKKYLESNRLWPS